MEQRLPKESQRYILMKVKIHEKKNKNARE